MSSELQLDVYHLNRWRRHLVNAYEVKGGMVFIAGKTVWSMPERFKVVCIPCKALYKCSALPFFISWQVILCVVAFLSIFIVLFANDQGCGFLVFLWDSDSSVRKFRTPDSPTLGRIVWHNCVLNDCDFAVTGATIWNNLPADLRLHSQSLLSLDKNWNSICLSHERTWGILFKSRCTNVRIIIIIIIKDDLREILNSYNKRCTIVYKQSFSSKINCTKGKQTAAQLHKSPDKTDRARSRSLIQMRDSDSLLHTMATGVGEIQLNFTYDVLILSTGFSNLFYFLFCSLCREVNHA